MNNLKFRRANSDNDIKELKQFFNNIFHPEKVGELAEVLTERHPNVGKDAWFLIEDTEVSKIVAGFVIIPWKWKFEGIELKVAESGIVGTDPDYRGKGLMRKLYNELDIYIKESGYDLSMIQGIPGFYHNFGYYYSVTMDNHINMPFHNISEYSGKDEISIRECTDNDIDFLVSQDEITSSEFAVSVYRDSEVLKYLLNDSNKTEYGGSFYVVENKTHNMSYYFKTSLQSFGTGLTINEISENIDYMSFCKVLEFCKKDAVKNGKPYIRLDLHNESAAGKMALSMGAEEGSPYAYQIKIDNRLDFIRKISPVLEKRLKNTMFSTLSAKLRIDMYKESVDISFNNGTIADVCISGSDSPDYTFNLPIDLFPVLMLGHRTWQELNSNRPDIAPQMQYLSPVENRAFTDCRLLIDTLFPKCKSWVYLQY